MLLFEIFFKNLYFSGSNNTQRQIYGKTAAAEITISGPAAASTFFWPVKAATLRFRSNSGDIGLFRNISDLSAIKSEHFLILPGVHL